VCRIVGRCIGFDSFGEFTGDLNVEGFGHIRALIFETFVFHRLSLECPSGIHPYPKKPVNANIIAEPVHGD
jgi:hypothetical protein